MQSFCFIESPPPPPSLSSFSPYHHAHDNSHFAFSPPSIAEENAIGLQPSNGGDADDNSDRDDYTDVIEKVEGQGHRLHGDGIAAAPPQESDGEGEGTLTGLPYVLFDPEDAPEGPAPRELTARQRKLRMQRSKAREAQRLTITKELAKIGAYF